MVEELVCMGNSTLAYTENGSFRDNSAKRYGGGLTVADENTLNFTGKMYSVVTQLTLTLVEKLL